MNNELFIQRILTAVPDKFWGQDYAAERFTITCKQTRSHRLMRRIAGQSGIKQRHLGVLEWQDTPDGDDFYRSISDQPQGPGMGKRNALYDVISTKLIENAIQDVPADELRELESLLTVSCTGASAPGLEGILFSAAPEIPLGVSRWNLGFMGCSAGLAALRLSHGLSGRHQKGLICTCELGSLHFQYSDEIDQITANMLFADGLALVVTGDKPSSVSILGAQSMHLPQASEQMTWFADDHGLRLTLARDLADTLGANLREAALAFLSGQGLSIEDIQHWVVHPGGPQILTAAEEALRLKPDQLQHSRDVLRDYGNMSSSTVFFVLKELMAQQPEGLGLAIAFGPGLTMEFVLLNFRRV
jgi:alkylresorcinol/alkylpyrone synthase